MERVNHRLPCLGENLAWSEGHRTGQSLVLSALHCLPLLDYRRMALTRCGQSYVAMSPCCELIVCHTASLPKLSRAHGGTIDELRAV
jgi:hypothetical protein